MKKLIFGVCAMLMLSGFTGQRGDIITAEAPLISDNMDVMITQMKVRQMNETLLSMGIPQYQFGNRINDKELVQKNFIYHVEILDHDWTFEDGDGYTWHQYKFTDTGRSLLNPGWAGDLYAWIANQTDRYLLPFDEIARMDGSFVMMGEEQTVADYTNFADFYGTFMNKHHYCITACMWAIYKAAYDNTPELRPIFEDSFKDPHVVHCFDTLTGGRFLGFFEDAGLIERIR